LSKYKRKYKRSQKSLFLAMLIIFSFCFIGVGYSYFNSTLSIFGTVTLGGGEQEVPKTEPLEVGVVTSNRTADRMHFEFNVKNISGEEILDWAFKLNWPEGCIIQFWGGSESVMEEVFITGRCA
jgi:hypothetical protein